MELLLGLITGVGLSAACGFRVFVPLLGMSIAHKAGQLELAQGFDWIGTWPALATFSTATLLEVVAYYIPWLDNFLDTVASPAAIVAGTVVTASQIGEISPWLQWTMAAIAGGGVCGVIQGGTVALRASSTAATGGAGNFVVTTLESASAMLVTILAVVVPIFCIVLVLVVCFKMLQAVRRVWLRKRATEPG